MLTALPPKHGSKSMSTDPNLRQAFRSTKPIEEMTLVQSKSPTKPRRKLTKDNKNSLEEAGEAYENEQAILNSLKSKNRPTSPSLSDDDFESADDGPESTLMERFKASKTESEVLRNRVFQLEKELKETQDFVFSMQPRAEALAESEALADFNSLVGSVEEWVQTKLGDSIESILGGTQKVAQLGQPAKILMNNIPPPGREAFRYRDTDEYNIIAWIMRCLCDWVLDRDFYCNIEKGGMEFLHTIERAMRNLEPRRGRLNTPHFKSTCSPLQITSPAELGEQRRTLPSQTVKASPTTTINSAKK